VRPTAKVTIESL